MAGPRFLRKSAEARARAQARARSIGIAQARANVARSRSMKAYWTRAHSYAAKHKIEARAAAHSPGFRREERLVKKGERGVPEYATTAQRRERATGLMRALRREGLRIGKGKTWRDYVRRSKRGFLGDVAA